MTTAQEMASAVPNIKAVDVRLLSAWATIASVLALAVLWRLVHHCFQLCVLARSPKLGRLKSYEARSPRVLAGHFTCVANAVVCLAAYMPAAQGKLAAAGWSLGALLPLSSRPLAIGPPLPGTGTFYLSLAAYCLHASLLSVERIAGGVAMERMALLQRTLLFLLASSVCMVECVPEVALALLLLELPSPCMALWQALQDFRLRSEPVPLVASACALFGIFMCRLVIFGLCIICAIAHPEASKKLWHEKRYFEIGLCVALLVVYVVHFARLSREVRKGMQDSKEVREPM